MFYLFIYVDEVAAKVAAHAADCYKEAYTSAKTESAKKIIPEVGEFVENHLLIRRNRD
jgi:hypothetical protein